jgi:serine/threonine protein phosphatase PrpC
VNIVSIPTLKNRAEQSMIIDRGGLQKPFSLDELIKKFTLKQESTLPPELSSITIPDTSDFAIVISTDLTDNLSFDETSDATASDDTGFSELLSPQPRRGKK